jgi:hypothetical protein
VNCATCGGLVTSSQRFCEDCGATLTDGLERSDDDGAAAAYTGAPGGPARVMHGTLPGSPVILGADEVIWKQYRVARLRTKERGEGTLYVTDSRVVFYARAKGRGTQRASMLVQQTKLEDITGLAAYVSRRISFGLIFLTFVCALGLIASLLAQNTAGIVIWIILTAGCAAALMAGAAVRGGVGVVIHSRATEASPISFGNFRAQHGLIGSILRPFLAIFGASTAFDVLEGFPGQDSRQVIEELGALILDLQTRGSLAAEHWSVDAGGEQARTRDSI